MVSIAIAARRRHRENALIDADLMNIRLASLLSTTAATFRTIDIHDLSAFGRQELGEPFFERFLQDLRISCGELILGCKSSLRPIRCTPLRLQTRDLAQQTVP
jgi:hypothetical protein